MDSLRQRGLPPNGMELAALIGLLALGFVLTPKRPQSWERLGKELKSSECWLNRTELAGRVFDYVLITRRSSVQI
jgi:hypothetical protein